MADGEEEEEHKGAQDSGSDRRTPLRVAILGGGIMGCCTAYFLTETLMKSAEKLKSMRLELTLLEKADEVARCASGKAGGFLARNWCSHSPVDPLAKKSFALHQRLASEWAESTVQTFYRALCTYDLKTGADKPQMKQRKSDMMSDHLSMFSTGVSKCSVIGKKDETAQVNPKEFCDSMIAATKINLAQIGGCLTELYNTAAVGIDFDESNHATAVKYATIERSDPSDKPFASSLSSSDTSAISSSSVSSSSSGRTLHGLPGASAEEGSLSTKSTDDAASLSSSSKGSKLSETINTLECDMIAVCMGPWTKESDSWFRRKCKAIEHVGGSKHSSVVMCPRGMSAEEIPAAAFFTHHESDVHSMYDFNGEIYPRSDGTVYCCSESTQAPLPFDPLMIDDCKKSTQTIIDALGAMSESHLKDATVKARQACYLPDTYDSLPMIGLVSGTANCFVATGHTCWGILNGPVTGQILSQLILHGKQTVLTDRQFSSFDPARMD